jgi:peptide/nickel transport system ATP-binding protein
MTLLTVSNLRTAIETREGTVTPVDDVTFSVEAGQTMGLVGESGSGKTMTGMSIMRLLPPGGSIVGGSITFEGRDLVTLDNDAMRRIRGNEIALISQDPMTSLNPTRTIGSQLREAYRIHTGASHKAATVRAIDVLGLVGMPRPKERLDDFPHQLSGGMRQRVMIAIGLLCEPKLLIADEPTTALDVSIQAQILDLIDELKTRLSMAVVLVTHDMGVIAGHADNVAVMYAGRVVEQADVGTLFATPRHRYTQALFGSMPTLELDSRTDLATIPGAPPKLIDLPNGCRFAARCRFARSDCLSIDPPLAADSAGHIHACFHPAEGDLAGELAELVDDAAQEDAVTENLEWSVLPDGADSPENSDSSHSETLVELVDLQRSFPVRGGRPFGPRATVKAVGGVSLSVMAGETLGIVGESGCGKTTIGRMLVGLDRPTAGSVSFEGRDLSGIRGRRRRRLRKDLQMMFQDSAAALDPRMRVSALIEEPLIAQGIGTSAERRATVEELLEAVGLPQSAGDRFAHEFSGGQRQRIAIARALTLRPKVIVADEPVSALDVSVQAQILNLMRSLQRRFGLTYVVISHDLSLLKYLADRIAVMYLGRLVELGPSDEVYRSPRHPYTAGLIDAIPLPDPVKERAKETTSLGGELPSAVNPPSGCHFRTRCPLATEVCATAVPQLMGDDNAHAVACHHPLSSTTTRSAGGVVSLGLPVPRA